MKASRMLPILSLLMLTQLVWGQIPQTISYQGVLRDSNDDLIDGTANLIFRLYDAESAGAQVWSETQNGVPVTDGVFNVSLGSSAATFAAAGLVFDQPYWLEIVVDGTALSPRIPLESAPYSFAAETAGSVVGTANVFPSTGYVGMGTTTPVAKLHIASPDVDGILLSDSSSGVTRATLLNWETFGGQLSLKDVGGGSQAVIRGYATPGGVQASFTAGKVGIGTSSPDQLLTVADTIHSTLGGFQFPDGSVQSTAASGGASGWSLTGNSIAAG
ncbi:MAG: hypothetical protein V3U35_05535, partial [Candidatus Neomarinimicrobiota bacterium]